MPGHLPPTLKLPSPSLNFDTSCEIASKHRCSLIYIDFNTSYQGIPICESFSHSAWVQTTSAKLSLHGCSPYMSSLLYAKLSILPHVDALLHLLGLRYHILNPLGMEISSFWYVSDTLSLTSFMDIHFTP